MHLIKSYSTTYSTRTGGRIKVKAFKTSDYMHKFLNTGDNALRWHEVTDIDKSRGLNKTGTYIEQGFDRFLNVKDIDASALAHMGGF
jgi:hypothetical protein